MEDPGRGQARSGHSLSVGLRKDAVNRRHGHVHIPAFLS